MGMEVTCPSCHGHPVPSAAIEFLDLRPRPHPPLPSQGPIAFGLEFLVASHQALPRS